MRRAVLYEAVVTGPVSVGYYEEGGEWYALAREFDLLGSGATPQSACDQLKELISDYVQACGEEHASRFLNPCPDADWERTSDRQEFLLTLAFRFGRLRGSRLRPQVRPEEVPAVLSKFRDHVAGVGLVELVRAAV